MLLIIKGTLLTQMLYFYNNFHNDVFKLIKYLILGILSTCNYQNYCYNSEFSNRILNSPWSGIKSWKVMRPVPSRGKKCAGARHFAGPHAPPSFQH